MMIVIRLKDQWLLDGDCPRREIKSHVRILVNVIFPNNKRLRKLLENRVQFAFSPPTL